MIKFVIFTLLIAPSALAKVSISAHYREPANTFDIMDCVSGWWDGTFCHDDGEYQREWEKRFGLSTEDRDLFKKYDAFRRKYYRGLGLPKEEFQRSDGLFAKRAAINEDVIAPVFYSSESLDEAYKKLQKVVQKEDAEFLVQFHARYRSQLKVLLNESKAFQSVAKKLNRELKDKRYQKFFSEVSRYYGTINDVDYEVLLSWWPPIERDNASPTDRFLVLRKNPIKHIDWDDKDVVFHEVVHTISARQAQENKDLHSKAFLKECPIETRLPRGHILEEPLAVAIGQIYFLSKFHPKSLKWESRLYSKPWISSYSKAIYPVVRSEIENGMRFSEETATKLGKLCAEYLGAAEALKSPVK